MNKRQKWMIALATALAGAVWIAPARAAKSLEEGAATTSPSMDLGRLRKTIAGLMDDDPAVRQSARDQLLSLRRRDLPAMKAALEGLAPLDPSLVQDLREIVKHVYLREEPYEADNSGFLGVRMFREGPIGRELPAKVEVAVVSRVAGFDAYRKLQDGDGILDIEEHPLGQPATRTEFINAVSAMRPGRVIHLKVLRQGKTIRVAVVVAAKPLELNLMDPDAFSANRDKVAGKYVDEYFGAILKGKGGDGQGDEAILKSPSKSRK